MMKNPTIKDVAKEAGVSIGTVDRVLHKRGRFSKETEQKVTTAIEKLQYKPSQIASALVSRRNHTRIGISYNGPSDNAFNKEILSGVQVAQRELDPFGVQFIVNSPESLSPEAQYDAIQSLVSQKVDGIITLPFNDNVATRKLSSYIPKEIPFATVTNTSWGQGQLFHIGPDDVALGSMIAKLISLYTPGGKAVILAPNYTLESTQRRVSGFIHKLETESLPITLEQVCPVLSNSFENCQRELEEKTALLASMIPDLRAIYVTNGFIEPVARTVSEKHLPVKVFGHEYFDGMADYLEADIICASLYQKTALQWYRACKMMYRHLSDPNFVIPSENTAEFNILLKETLSSVQIGAIFS